MCSFLSPISSFSLAAASTGLNSAFCSCSIEASWGKIGMTEIRIYDFEELKKCVIFR